MSIVSRWILSMSAVILAATSSTVLASPSLSLYDMDAGALHASNYDASVQVVQDQDLGLKNMALQVESGTESEVVWWVWNPFSFSVTSGCFGSACGASGCLLSGCAGSACPAGTSVCAVSICIGSVCLGSTCVSSTCDGSICFGSNCGASLCSGSGCNGSWCSGSACSNSLCQNSGCDTQNCEPPSEDPSPLVDNSALPMSEILVAADIDGGVMKIATKLDGLYTILYQNAAGDVCETTVTCRNGRLVEIAVENAVTLVSVKLV